MAIYSKYNQFVEDLAKGVHNFSSHVFKVALSNGVPAATHAILGSISELTTGAGYTAGGLTTAITGFPQVSGTLTIVAANPSVWTASGAGIIFRYGALYNSSVGSPVNPLIAFWDNGSSTTVTAGNTLQISFGANLFTVI